ncbi:MAG: hypothetical protein K0R90_1331, partial [Oscillospiraceae bacterium]|nr:hypothetical protein [Oscillospiraceae bacterium]
MKRNIKLISWILSLSIVISICVPFSNAIAASATATIEWQAPLATAMKSGGSFNTFNSSYPIAGDWLIQDCKAAGDVSTSAIMTNSSTFANVVKKVDATASSSDSIDTLVAKYAVAVEKRSVTRLHDLMTNVSTQFVVVKNKQMGGSHYAYTESVSDERSGNNAPKGQEYDFYPNTEMVLLTLTKTDDRVVRSEQSLLKSPSGIIRDPDVSEDGTTVLFSWKQSTNDDYHLYTLDLRTKTTKQLTFGQGISDTEPKFLPNGSIIFSSTRIIQYVDCWKIPVSNLFTCTAEGKNITRYGFDQVHTTYPTVTSDGRVLYTRWDYNDRNQMFIQGVFQMFPDGTNQTELFGNNSNFPTTLVHTTEIPGSASKYFSIATGHHTLQAGKLVKIDTSKGRNNKDSVDFVFPDAYSNKNASTDAFGQQGALYKYPYAINEEQFVVSAALNGWSNSQDGQQKRETPFNEYYMDTNGNRELLSAFSTTTKSGASQIAPVKTRTLFERPSMVNYGVDTGTYYIGNIYEGGGLKDVPQGTAKQLRIVALDYRSSAIGKTEQSNVGSGTPHTPVATGEGTWDVKQVLGVVDIEPDGSALFKVPARVPIYFQVLDKDGELIQSMRSWSTVMPNETFSCVGCHEDKNSVPPALATPTMAMAKGVQEIQPEGWQDDESNPYGEREGFSYLKEIQPIFDKSCIQCHSDTSSAYTRVGADASTIQETVLSKSTKWKYTTTAPATGWSAKTFDSSAWSEDTAPFGTVTTTPKGVNTTWSSSDIWLRNEFTVNNYQFDTYEFKLNTAYTQNAEVYVNGTKVTVNSGTVSAYTDFAIPKSLIEKGKNTIAVKVSKATSGQFFDCSIIGSNPNATTKSIIPIKSEWQYKLDTAPASNWSTVIDNSSGWNSGMAPFGSEYSPNTSFTNNKFWVRKAFTLTAEDLNKNFYLNLAYDQDPQVFVNGTKIFSVGGFKTTYTMFDVTSSIKSALKIGTNVIGIYIDNGNGDQGGRGVDCGLIASENVSVSKDLLPIKSAGWKYTTSATSSPISNWYTESFSDSSWATGTAAFGKDGGAATPWTELNTIYIRKTFTVANLNDVLNSDFYLNIFYDESPKVYLNGQLIFEAANYNQQYDAKKVTGKVKAALKQGTNVIAACATNTTGGQMLDCGISYLKRGEHPVSLSGQLLANGNASRYFPLSYLVLTESGITGDVIGKPTNDNLNWIDSMSQCEMLDPYQYGSSKSGIIDRLRNNSAHKGLVSEDDIRKIAAWIDLGVPLCGTYDELNNWSNNEKREFEEKENKRANFELADAASVAARAGKVDASKQIEIKYTSGSTTVKSVKDSGLVQLFVTKQFATGDKITVTLPAGEKYFYFNIDQRLAETIIYCPSGTYEYTVPADLSKLFPQTMVAGSAIAFSNLTISAKLPTEKELTEKRNLSVNPYDTTNASTAYPHATAKNFYNNQSEFAPRNAIDGFTANKGHGNYPVQSWGPQLGDDNWYQVNFGREVYVNEVDVIIRADFPHDTHYVSAVLEFCDGTTQNVNLIKTADA